MKIIAVDDEKLALEGLMSEIALVVPDAEINGFRNGRDALNYCEGQDRIDAAFLDIEMRGMSGLSLGRKLVSMFEKINLIYTTGFSEYAVEAVDMRCSGYILKPVTGDKIRKELENLRYPVESGGSRRLFARTFGKFEAFVDGKPVKFHYQKTKELLAYLIDREGILCGNSEIADALWDDDSFEGTHTSYLKNIRSDLIKTLDEQGCMDCITRGKGEIGIIRDAIDCDYYSYLDNKGVEGYEKLFKGEYMSQYSWAEYTLASLMGGREEWS
ncbi:MAG: response regulator [Lachnospiraceae bacterium]|nr:response regulator [Lachnospiraceae bacterium]